MSDQVYIIAEAGVNHNGSLDLAKALVDAAKEAGADAVKFQTFSAKDMVSGQAPKAKYQTVTTDPAASQLEMLRSLELGEAAHAALLDHCVKKGIQFLSTPFDIKSVDLLQTLNVPLMKLSSGDLTNAPLLLHVARTGRPVMLSTGMSTLAEVEAALAALAFGYLGWEESPSIAGFRRAYASSEGWRLLEKQVTLLHCTTEYPAPFADVHLRAMDTLKAAFGLPVGYSDHTPGYAVAIAAAARGAVVIEKHLTLDCRLPGPDHQASLEPEDFARMVAGVRQVKAALGQPVKVPAAAELKNMAVARKSLVAARQIAKGEPFSAENLVVKRPGNGLSPLLYWEVLGKKAPKGFEPDELVTL